jgi:hypothetical protein
VSFDVGKLPGRAKELKELGVDANYKEATRFGGNASSALKLAKEAMAGVESIYDDFLDIPAPEDFVSRLDDLSGTLAKLATEGHTTDPVTGGKTVSGHNANLARVGTSGGYLASWTGNAASTYQSNYADQFIGTASSQFAAASGLLNAINAEAAVWQTVRADLDELSSRAIEYMKHAGDCGGAEWAMGLTIAAAVVAIPVTGGASAIIGPAVAAGLTVTATGISAASGAPKVDDLKLDAGSSDALIESLHKALEREKTHIHEQEQKIRDAMSSSAKTLDANWKTFCLPRPAISDASQYPVNDPNMGGYDA